MELMFKIVRVDEKELFLPNDYELTPKIINEIRLAREKAQKEGIKQRNLEIAKTFVNSGVPTDVITNSTGLSEVEIMKLKSK